MSTRWFASALFAFSALALFVGTEVAIAEEPKALLVLKESAGAIVTAGETKDHAALNIGNQVIYGQSATHVAILSRLPYSINIISGLSSLTKRDFALQLIDKSAKIEEALALKPKTFPVEGHIMSYLEGPLDTLLLTAEHAYYFSPFPRAFTLVQFALATGKATRITYPLEIRNPRITGATIAGTEHLFAYGKNEAGVWRYDAKRGEFVSIDPDEAAGANSDPRFTFEAEKAASASSPSKTKVADLAYLPKHGLFKLTTEGTLSLLLNSELTPPADAQALALNGSLKDATGERLLPSPHGEPRLGLLVKKSDDLEVVIVNLITFELENRISLPKTTLPNTIYPFLMGKTGEESAVYLLNAATTALERHTPTKSETIRKVPKLDQTPFSEDRILYLQNGG